ncbi:MAG TPA: hypothetical protein PLE74_01025 [Candidatus Cloacimonadota bacterium]|nr:hypothetical protein [Candidatus Cloacimonadota bacterium]
MKYYLVFESIGHNRTLTWIVKSKHTTPFQAWFHESLDADPTLGVQNDRDLVSQDDIFVFTEGKEISEEVFNFLKSLGIRSIQ